MNYRIVYRIGLLVALIALAVLGFAWSGFYNIGADVPHSPFTYRFLTMVREHSVQRHAKSIGVPNLQDPSLILKGAGQYAAMCTGCHLAPGMHDSEIRAGLYPQPPDLSQTRVDPREAFWTIKHGIKMSAMPAWGATHDDMTIWSMVAFLQKLPSMTPAQYKDIVAKAPPDEDMDMGDGMQKK
ncbi:cytochrome c [Dyella psychrodurans]|uniref:Cytochrome c n=1 Tax=Dyella psychrodurans TaxID=1927960 RepID=A0A370XDF0_9GAMM|nr:cytochrome c [Dyella psychrodurans]RDS86251.1 cytochrome c [Dyella psychrodurans]